ncbi:MAG TPA: YtxH domain-containing protein [Anaerolineales bacterium]|nr:YtxH domain-containing protein [Anaerolineales bacterium]
MNRILVPIISFAAGVLVGGILALVLAPTSGEELRSEIRLRAESQWNELNRTIQEMRQATTALEETNAEMGAMVKKGAR